MATDSGPSASSLSGYALLRREPWRFSFYQAMRILESEFPRDSQWGYGRKASDDPVRLAQEPSMIMAPSSLSEFATDSGRPPRLSVLFYGLFGPQGPLPFHLTEYARERVLHHQDDALVAFLDMFHHRLLTYFYRIWADATPTANLERHTDVYAQQLNSIFGLIEGPNHPTDRMPNQLKRFFSGHLGSEVKHPEALLDILKSILTMPVFLEEFVGRWLVIEDRDLLRIHGQLSSQRLGRQATLGGRTWQKGNKFRLRIGALSLAQYLSLLPGGGLLEKVVSAVDSYIGGELDWDMNLVLAKDEATPTRPGTFGQLGWTTWLVDGPQETDLDDLALNPSQTKIDNVLGSVAR